MNRVGRSGVFLLLVAALLSGGCAAKQVQPLPKARVQAMEHNRRGIEAQSRGEQEKALAEFEKALRLQTSIDNTEGMIVALVNGGRTQRLKGDLQGARDSIERALALLPEGSELASELRYEKAKVLLAAGDVQGASEWAVKAEAAEKGDQAGRRKNLVAALLLRQGLTGQAREQAEQALELNRKAELTGEEGNSLRLLAEIHLVQGSYDRAGDGYRQALALDKKLGLGAKIACDLSGLGAVAAKSGDTAGAIAWLRRAFEVSRSGGETSLAVAAGEQLAALYRLQGEAALAQQMEEERKKLLAGATK